MKSKITKIETIERSVFIGFMLFFLLFAAIGSVIGTLITVLTLSGVKIYIYTIYKKQGKVDEFWRKTSKPVLVALGTILLIVILDHYEIFSLILSSL